MLLPYKTSIIKLQISTSGRPTTFRRWPGPSDRIGWELDVGLPAGGAEIQLTDLIFMIKTLTVGLRPSNDLRLAIVLCRPDRLGARFPDPGRRLRNPNSLLNLYSKNTDFWQRTPGINWELDFRIPVGGLEMLIPYSTFIIRLQMFELRPSNALRTVVRPRPARPSNEPPSSSQLTSKTNARKRSLDLLNTN